jgi:hypothetical protein
MGLSDATARLLTGSSVSAGQSFRIDASLAPPSLYVYVPKSAPGEILFESIAEFAKLRRTPADLDWVTDPAAQNVTHVIFWNGSQWILEKLPQASAPRVAPVSLGDHPRADQIAGLVKATPSAKSHVFAMLPPTPELAKALRLGDDSNNSVKLVDKPADANYRFIGRMNGDEIEYAWVRDFGSAGKSASLENDAHDQTPLPSASNWATLAGSQNGLRITAAALTESALRLARVRAWFVLRSPCCDASFPYHLALKNITSGEFNSGGDFRDGDQIKIYLRSAQSKADLQKSEREGKLKRRFVYVFIIDHLGEGALIFGGKEKNDRPNLLPQPGSGAMPIFDSLIAASDMDYEFSISPPFGVDSYFLVTSEEPIDPGVFSFSGVVSRGTGGGLPTALSQALQSLGSPTRTEVPPIKVQWSIETVSIRSVPAAK